MQRHLDANRAAGADATGGLPGTLSRWFLKPADVGAAARPAPKGRSVDELEQEHRDADDRERMLGLLGAPVAAGIGFVVAHYAHGTVTSKSEVLIVALVLALAMLVLAWLRKRTYLGIAMALYGLSIFSLGFWGFGVPFVFAAAWLLVRAYRTQREPSEAPGTPPAGQHRSRRTPTAGAGRRKAG